jgi:hypothetical protein
MPSGPSLASASSWTSGYDERVIDEVRAALRMIDMGVPTAIVFRLHPEAKQVAGIDSLIERVTDWRTARLSIRLWARFEGCPDSAGSVRALELWNDLLRKHDDAAGGPRVPTLRDLLFDNPVVLDAIRKYLPDVSEEDLPTVRGTDQDAASRHQDVIAELADEEESP